MAKVFLTCASTTVDHPFVRRDLERLSAFALCDRHGTHSVVDQPEAADLVVFVGSARPNLADITKSILYRRFRDQAVLFFSGDRAIPLLPGIYTCLERHPLGNRSGAIAGFYLRVTQNNSLDIEVPIEQADYLYSFVGNACNHPLRAAICRLSDSRAFMRDSSKDDRQQDDGISGANCQRGLHYRDIMARSKFILCPRGIGVSSWRLFETLRAGRVPVVLSDGWIRPPGPDWDAISLSVPEARVRQLPEILAQEEYRAVKMGAQARQEWERWYAEDTVFHTAVEHLLLAHRLSRREGLHDFLVTYTRYIEPFYIRHWVLSPLKQRLLALVNGRG